mgnify:CR=1 FL=1
MQKSIETIWKEGFLEDDKLVAPKLNNLYNQKSRHLVDKLRRTFRINLIALVIMAIAFLVIHYFLDAIWQGMVAAISLIALALPAEAASHQVEQEACHAQAVYPSPRRTRRSD